MARCGIAGLRDLPRSGKPPVYEKQEFRLRVLKALEQPAPKDQATWDGPSLARELQASTHAVWRVLRREGICLRRQRSWCVSTDPEFAAKAADIVGLYLDPPLNALVISVDEKLSIQALSRPTGYVQTSSGKIVRGIKSTYKRNDDWLARYEGRVVFHFTPTSASWLNLVEVWFGLLTRQALRDASFPTKAALREAIEDFIAATNGNPRPFVWRKREVRGAQLRNTIVNLRH